MEILSAVIASMKKPGRYSSMTGYKAEFRCMVMAAHTGARLNCRKTACLLLRYLSMMKISCLAKIIALSTLRLGSILLIKRLITRFPRMLFATVRSADFPLFPSSPARFFRILGQNWVRHGAPAPTPTASRRPSRGGDSKTDFDNFIIRAVQPNTVDLQSRIDL